MDVHTVFQNGTMNRDQLIYMRQSCGYHDTEKEALVCGLQKSISGPKQVIMVIYVDELTIMSKRMRLINKIKAEFIDEI
ncbi:Integrase catalytic core protein [Phytophthora palmivora]|uniref:Integrase catalytic core protein n=1 Tax=Phytophthora palmivora TaxID=4796 RepID=A0A2P4YNB1_9STRA|nr:Integrase catalytic core protein [Phytophthora palmivora]